MKDVISADNKVSYGNLILSATVGVVGLLFSSVAIAYIAGMFGISTALASQIVNAVSVGGLAFGIAMAVGTGGVAAAAVATARWAIGRWGKRAAVA